MGIRSRYGNMVGIAPYAVPSKRPRRDPTSRGREILTKVQRGENPVPVRDDHEARFSMNAPAADPSDSQ